MTHINQYGGRRGTYVAAAIAVVLVVAGAVFLVMGARGSDGPPPPDNAAASAPPSSPSPSHPSRTPETKVPTKKAPSPPAATPVDFGRVLPGSEPVALDIPAIDVHSRNIVGLELADDGTIEVPRDPAAPGWFTPGPSPGQLGPAVIAGHVDSTEGPAVFYELGNLRPGDLVRVTRADSSVAVFAIDRVAVFEQADFPTRQVYGLTTSRPELRLITCGGEYDPETGYVDNVVAFGHLVGARRA